MLDMSNKAVKLTSGKDRLDYNRDETLQLALTHIIQILGEAAQHVSDMFRAAHPEVPWHEIIGMRHRIVHDYMNVDEDVIWEVIQQDIPALIEVLRRIVPPE
jgi:uncharacterized protein with HEPN domain